MGLSVLCAHMRAYTHPSTHHMNTHTESPTGICVAHRCTNHDRRVVHRNQFSPPTMWALWVEHRPLVVVRVLYLLGYFAGPTLVL